MTDLFDEVEEQLRSARYRTLALKALPWVIAGLAAALIAALGYWGWDSYRTREAAKASEQYSAALEAFNAGQDAKAVALWGEIAKSRSAGYKSLSLMQLGGVKLAARKTDEAVKLFDEAAEAAPDPVIGDAARLKSALAVLDTAPYAEVETRLKPLLEDGRPYRMQALEAMGFAKIMKGDIAGARGDFVAISSMLDVSESARGRAQAAITLIDSGSAKAVPAAARAAAALPPQTAPILPQQPPAPGPQ